jgi:leader peptidase (prepilin peptidase) / N-methyltransferase
LTLPIWIVFLIAAPFVGSFLGVVATRCEDGRPIALARSQCDQCRHTLGWSDLIPVVSWLWLKRRCRYCGVRLGAFYPLIELAAIVPVAWAATLMSGWLLAASAVLGWVLIVLALIDWRTYRLPDALTVFLGATGFAAAYFFDRMNFLDHLIGAAAGFAAFALLAFLYRAIRKRDGLGLGDAKLLAGLGAWLAWEGIPTTIFLAAVLALTFMLVRSLAGRGFTLAERLPFGPFLAFAGWIVWLYGPLVIGFSP